MALNKNRPLNEETITEGTTSIATTPIAAYGIAPCSGYVQRCMAGAAGTTTGTITVAVAINGGSDICNSTLTIAAGAGSIASSVVEVALMGAGTTSGVWINEGDFVSFTPSGGTGSSIGGSFTMVIRKVA